MRIESIGPLGRIGLSGRSAAVGRASPSAHPVGDEMTMMRPTVTQKTLLAALAALTCAGTFVLDAPADTGGVIAASRPAGHAAPPKAAAHASSIDTWFGPGFYGRQTAC